MSARVLSRTQVSPGSRSTSLGELFTICTVLRTLLTLPCSVSAAASTDHWTTSLCKAQMIFQAYITGVTATAGPAVDRGRLTRTVAGGFRAVGKIARPSTRHQYFFEINKRTGEIRLLFDFSAQFAIEKSASRVSCVFDSFRFMHFATRWIRAFFSGHRCNKADDQPRTKKSRLCSDDLSMRIFRPAPHDLKARYIKPSGELRHSPPIPSDPPEHCSDSIQTTTCIMHDPPLA